MASVRLQLNPGYEQQLAQLPELREKALRPAVRKIAEEVRQNAPRRSQLPPGRRRHYVQGISSEVTTDEQGRFVGRVNAFHFTSLWIEFGSVNNPAYAPLRRALDGMQGRAL